MTTHAQTSPTRPRIRATLIGLGLDGGQGPQRIITGKECLVVGGSEETHAEMIQTMLKLETELDRRGCALGDVPPEELAEIARRIDSPELEAIAVRIAHGLARRGLDFSESTPDDLTEMAAG
jgi:hypothetical protein